VRAARAVAGRIHETATCWRGAGVDRNGEGGWLSMIILTLCK
jgi:hypothetical protein